MATISQTPLKHIHSNTSTQTALLCAPCALNHVLGSSLWWINEDCRYLKCYQLFIGGSNSCFIYMQWPNNSPNNMHVSFSSFLLKRMFLVAENVPEGRALISILKRILHSGFLNAISQLRFVVWSACLQTHCPVSLRTVAAQHANQRSVLMILAE